MGLSDPAMLKQGFSSLQCLELGKERAQQRRLEQSSWRAGEERSHVPEDKQREGFRREQGPARVAAAYRSSERSLGSSPLHLKLLGSLQMWVKRGWKGRK